MIFVLTANFTSFSSTIQFLVASIVATDLLFTLKFTHTHTHTHTHTQTNKNTNTNSYNQHRNTSIFTHQVLSIIVLTISVLASAIVLHFRRARLQAAVSLQSFDDSVVIRRKERSLMQLDLA